jgi:hypothetical protein
VGNTSLTYFLKFFYFTFFPVQEEATDDMLADFEREATLLSEFDHPNIGNPHSICTCSSQFSASGSGFIWFNVFGSRPRSRKPKTANKKVKNSKKCT